jgi:DNA (cytosine-5)-methyltransferase 1
MENVSGMVKGKLKIIFAEIMRELKASDYNVRTWLLNAMYFGVPQSRQRMIFIGIRNNISREVYPPAVLADSVITVRDAWCGLDADVNEDLSLTPLYAEYWRTTIPGASLGKLQTTKRLSEHQPAQTIVKSEGNGGLYHPTEPRKLSHEEFKRLASYPDEFKFVCHRKRWQEQIGNSVPPLFMKAIAEHVRTTLIERSGRAEAA